ncbi:hypothetical protein EUX98_g2166 [Antrodiella citrinella]|uniref:Major facilitator superfamily (MFS) profile domain-containing protein n=1 Tax=Antrodiella citrinella TaxID=2447956 RepID=A0A4S4MZQ5_9APHY|nr:hypothetical protein EUX98_g2166 [Antrodiella citrinella]
MSAHSLAEITVVTEYPPAVDHDYPPRSVDETNVKNAPGSQSGYFDSALEEADSVSSVDLSALSVPTSERIRRRSVLERVEHAHRSPLGVAPAVNEFPDLSPVYEYPGVPAIPLTRASTSLQPGQDISLWSTREDLELASQAQGSAASTALAMTSSLPPISASQRAVFMRKSWLHLAPLYYCLFLQGWNDGSTGPMLPTIQRYYHVGFAIVSILFVVNCVGYISGAMMNVYLNDRFGFGKASTFHLRCEGACIQLVAYVLLSTGGPFPVMCLGFGFVGCGLALQNAQANGFVGSAKEHASTKFGLLHASYGMGAFIAPLVATQFSQQRHWYFHYVISAGISLSNIVILYLVFRFRSQDEIFAEEGQAAGEVDLVSQSKYKQIINLRIVHFLSVFALIYVGTEVTLGGWIVTFIQQKRGGGLMLGRLCLMWLNKKIGERRVMFLYAFLAIQLEVTIWVVPSLFENAIAIACIGVLLGPMYPILMHYCTGVLPRWLLTGCMGWIGGVGQAGSAVLPFVTGLLASKFGIGSLQPLATLVDIAAVGHDVRFFFFFFVVVVEADMDVVFLPSSTPSFAVAVDKRLTY